MTRVTHLAILPLLALAALVSAPAPARDRPVARSSDATGPRQELLDYLARQHSTGIVVVKKGRILLDHSWKPDPANPSFRTMLYGRTGGGELLEDVASQQKSFVAVLMAIALDRGLVALDRPVTAYLGAGWSHATAEQESRITVDHILQMNSGLDERFAHAAAPGTVFLYNTPVYAITKRILETASGKTLEAITREWLTVPAAMADTDWRQRPAALASVGNATGLVTTPRDIATFGRLVLGRGVAPNGRRVVSANNLRRLFEPSSTNPAYGRLWWLNGGSYAIRAPARRTEGPLVRAAPSDTVAALGALDRRLYVVPSKQMVIVRTGAAVTDRDFDEQLWRRLALLFR